MAHCGRGTGTWLPHGEGRHCRGVEHEVRFTPAHVAQVRILQLLDESWLAPRKPHKAADTTACFHRVLPALLAMAAAPDRAVRCAALASMQAFAASVKPSSSHAEGTLTGMAASSRPPPECPTKDCAKHRKQHCPYRAEKQLERALRAPRSTMARSTDAVHARCSHPWWTHDASEGVLAIASTWSYQAGEAHVVVCAEMLFAGCVC